LLSFWLWRRIETALGRWNKQLVMFAQLVLRRSGLIRTHSFLQIACRYIRLRPILYRAQRRHLNAPSQHNYRLQKKQRSIMPVKRHRVRNQHRLPVTMSSPTGGQGDWSVSFIFFFTDGSTTLPAGGGGVELF
jgi:hypothetical protein